MQTPCGAGSMLWRTWGDGLPLVLLHGGYGSWTHWLRNIPELSNTFQVIVPDMPGYGESAEQPEPQTLDALAAVLADGLSQVIGRSDRFALAGFSFGGVVAGHLAALMPERVVRLVLLGAGGLALPRPSSTPKLTKWRDMPDEAARRDAHRSNLAAVMFADPGTIDDLALHLQTENTLHARRKSRATSLTDALRRKLDTVHLPLAGIWGEHDVYTGPHVEARRTYLAGRDPDLSFVVVSGAGHWVQYEQPTTVNAALRAMLASPSR